MDYKDWLIKQWLKNISTHCLALYLSDEKKREELKKLFDEKSLEMLKTIGEC